MNRETFGIQRRTENPWAALMQPNQVDLSWLDLQPQEEESSGIGEAIASGIGSIGGAWAQKRAEAKYRKEGGISKEKWKAMKNLPDAPQGGGQLGSGREATQGLVQSPESDRQDQWMRENTGSPWMQRLNRTSNEISRKLFPSRTFNQLGSTQMEGISDPSLRAINPMGATEESYSGARIISDPTTKTPQMKMTDPQMMFRKMRNSGRVFGWGGKLKQGLNIVGDEGPEIAIKEGEDVEILPMDKLHPGQNARQKYGNPPMEEEVVAEETVTEQPVRQLSPADKTYAEISRREGKDWKGKDRAKTHNWKDVIKSILLGAARAGQSVGRGDNATSSIGKLLGGAIAGGVGTAVDRNADEKLGNEMMLEKLRGRHGQQRQAEQEGLKTQMMQTQLENTKLKPVFEKLKLDQQQAKIENKFLMDQRNYDRLVQMEEGRNVRAGNQTKVQEVDGYLFRAYPNDPQKPLEPIIDPRTGKQAFNPANVAQEITFEDGTKAWAKGGQIVSGKFAGERQAKQQEFAGQQNDKDRALRREQFLLGFQQKIADDARAMANDAVKRSQWIVEQTRNIQKDLADGKLDDDTANAMIEALGKFQ